MLSSRYTPRNTHEGADAAMSITLSFDTSKRTPELHEPLWKIALSALLTELHLDLGIGTAPEEAEASKDEDSWGLKYKLDPERAGAISMTVFDDDQNVMFLAMSPKPSDDFDLEPSFQAVAKRLSDGYAVNYTLRVTAPGELI